LIGCFPLNKVPNPTEYDSDAGRGDMARRANFRCLEVIIRASKKLAFAPAGKSLNLGVNYFIWSF